MGVVPQCSTHFILASLVQLPISAVSTRYSVVGLRVMARSLRSTMPTRKICAAWENWINLGQAENMDDILEATRTIGIPWVNTIAADRFGEGFYGDVSVVPNASQALIDTCVRPPYGHTHFTGGQCGEPGWLRQRLPVG